jgi:hypothetical protein
MSAHSTDKGRWRWRKISPRRMTGTILEGFGLVGVMIGALNYVKGEWNPSLDPQFLAGSALLLLVGFVVLWRVKPAPWP